MADDTTATQDKLDAILARHTGEGASVTALLQDVHAAYGYLPEDVLREVSRRTGAPVSLLYSLATFYGSFRLEPMGKHHICVCVGTACHVRGAAKVVDAMERELQVSSGGTTPDAQFTLDTVNCVGACAMGPVVVEDKEYHGQMDQRAALKLIRRLREGGSGST
jgi:NADH-quinone oxidoreductase subunit E